MKSNFPPFFVIKKNAAQNQLVVGFGTDALCQKFKIVDQHWIDDQKKIEDQQQLWVRIRHTGELLPCQLKGEQVILDQPTQGVAAGQSAVFYSSNICLGGGVISE